MTRKLTIADIQALGFEWPKHAIIAEHAVINDGEVDLRGTLERLRTSQALYRKQLNDAFTFKSQYGADYSDFSDRYDDYARIYHELKAAINHLQQILETTA